jgi:Leucine-rich repeat (LRR) protein
MNISIDYASIEVNEYLLSLPLAITHIDIEYRNLSQLPDLSRFTHLQELQCGNNKLTHLPSLPPNLESLSCDNNEITHLPSLPDNLESLSCDNNKLTHLPPLNHNLRHLYCSANKLTSLPKINDSLYELHCDKNNLTELPYVNNLHLILCTNNKLMTFPDLNNLQVLYCNYNPITNNIPEYISYDIMKFGKILNRVKHLFYSLKYKGKFRRWLWINKEKNAMLKYSPHNLEALLLDVEDENDEYFQQALDTW